MHPINLDDFESIARERLPEGVFDYIAGGAEDEVTLRENRAAFGRYRILPRMLVDVSAIELSTVVLGERIAFPVLLAPAAFQAMAHPDGELATARAAAAAGTILVVSTFSAFPLEEVAAATVGPRWFQLYCYRDRAVTREFVERAGAAGYSAICLTVDVPRLGRRERDLRNEFELPPGIRARNFGRLANGMAVSASQSDAEFNRYIRDLVDPTLTWEVVDWLRSVTSLPVLVKGILTPADARLAVEHGAGGIVVSNHGARQLDGVPPAIEVLAEVVETVQGGATVLMDGGVRRGTDVLKAIALGADAVLIGRPYIWGLAAAGERGVRKVLSMLREEFETAMALAGCATIGDINSSLVRRV